MDDRVPRDRYPWWVKFGLLGAESRRGQWFFVWLYGHPVDRSPRDVGLTGE